MTAFHQTFFESQIMVNASGYMPVLHDESEPAYFLTWTLFNRLNSQVTAFRDILRRTTGIKALRRSRVASGFFPGTLIPRDFRADICWWGGISYICGHDLINHVTPNVPVGVYVTDNRNPGGGEFVGPRGSRFRKLNLLDKDLIAIGALWGLGDLKPLRAEMHLSGGVEKVVENIHASAGGGILGAVTYTIKNLQYKDMAMDGGKVVPRKWSANVLRDFLCISSLPNLRPEQVAGQVNTSSTYEFRRAASCVACHAQVDPLAFTARNLTGILMGPGTKHVMSMRTIISKPVTQPSEVGLVEGGPDYHFGSRPPKGELFFNNWRNLPVRVPVQGLAQLGQAISEQDDFYLCAAKRYYRFFTGVDVNIRAVEANMRPLEREHFRNVVKAGLEVLKSTQSTERMIEFIFSTPAFKYSDFRSEVKIP